MCELKQNELLFKISGKLHSVNIDDEEYTQYLSKNCDLYYNNFNDRNNTDTFFSCLVSNLNKKTREIEQEISLLLKEKLYIELNHTNIKVNPTISFKVGSVEWTGLISYTYDLVEITANIGGAVVFIDLAKNIINDVVSKFIKNEFNGSTKHFANSIDNMTNTNIELIQNNLLTTTKSPKSIEDYFSPINVLIYITIINIVFFVGGTVYSGITIDSIRQQYVKSEQTTQKSRDKYLEAEYKLKTLKDDLDKSKEEVDKLIIKELENYNKNIHKKFEPLIESIKQDLDNYENQIIIIDKQSKNIKIKMNSLDELNEKSKKLFENSVQYSEEIELISNQLYSKKNMLLFDFFHKLWTNGDSLTKSLMIIVLLYLLTPIFIIARHIIIPTTKYIKRKIYNKT